MSEMSLEEIILIHRKINLKLESLINKGDVMDKYTKFILTIIKKLEY